MKKFIMLFILIFFNNTFGIKLNLDLVGTSYLSNNNSFWIYNLFDDSFSTLWVEGVKKDGSGTNGYKVFNQYQLLSVENNGVGEYLVVSFKNYKEIAGIDTIKLYNANSNNYNRIKELGVLVTYKYGTNFSNKYFVAELKNTKVNQIKLSDYSFDKSNITGFTFWIVSTYPGTDTNNHTAISEIEFWYKGKKYEIANLEEAKREFIEKRKLMWYSMLVSTGFDPVETAKVNKYVRERLKNWQGNEFECDLTTNSMKILKEMGFDVDKYLYQYGGDRKNPILGWKIYLQFGLDKKIYFFKRVNERETEEAYLWDYEKVKIGEWDVDEMGTLWIKLDGREKKAAIDERLSGTDLEFLDPIALEKDSSEGYVIGLRRKYKVIGIRKIPTKQWWEFWKSYKEYRFNDAPIFLIKLAVVVEDLWIYLRKAYEDNALIWIMLIVACLIFAIVRREGSIPLWARIMSIVNSVYIIGIIVLDFIDFAYFKNFIEDNLYIDNLPVVGLLMLIGLLLCVVVSLSLLVILIVKWKKIKIFDKIGYFLYAIFICLSYYFIVEILF